VALSLFGTPQSAGQGTTVTSVTVNVPNGNTIVSVPTIAIIGCGSISAGTPTWVTPATFTTNGAEQTPSATSELDIFYKQFAGGATLPTSVTLTAGGAGATAGGCICVAYQGFNVATPFDGSPVTANSSTSTTTAVGPAITTTVANDIAGWFYLVVGDIGAGTNTVSQGTLEIDVNRATLAANGYIAYADNAFAATGSTGTNTLTYNTAEAQKAMITLALQPATSGGGGTTTGSSDFLGGQFSTNFPGWSQFQ
jgi:hypothetical protein